MKCKPFYHPQAPAHFRVVYRCSGLWVAQRNTELKATRTFDPWENLHTPVKSREVAIKVMYNYCPITDEVTPEVV